MAFRIDVGSVARELSEIKRRSLSAAERVAESAAAKMEEDAKRGAPWKDRTGAARQSIRGFSGRSGSKLRCGVSGNVEYFTVLELGNEGRGAILGPTVQANAPQVLEQFRNVLG